MSSTVFVVTDYGLAAAASAANTGIKIQLSTFKVGSGYGYTPLSTMTSLQGATLYSDNITTFSNTPDGALLMVCQLSPQAGTFQFGEIGIYDNLGNLFALAALDSLQTKYSGLGSNVNSSVQFNCLLKLAQGTAIFSLPSVNQITEIEYLSAWNLVTAPSVSPFPNSTEFIITELTSSGQQSILIKEAGDTWSVSDPWVPAFMGTSLTTSSLSNLTFTLPSQFTTLDNVGGIVQGSWLVESNNIFRMGTLTVTGNVATLTYSSYVSSALTGQVNIYTNVPDILERSLREQAITITNSNITALQASVNISLANRVRVDVSNQGLIPTQKLNAQTNIGLSPGDTVAFTNIQQGGSQVLSVANYNAYAPNLTGSGASGTWNISILGNAATANNANTVTTLTYAQTIAAIGYTPYNASNPAGYISGKLGLGITGETWKYPGRSFNTTYTNPYSYPIAVSATASCAVTSVIYAYVNGGLVSFFQWQFNGCGSFGGAFIIVPAYATYQLNSSQGVNNWTELY